MPTYTVYALGESQITISGGAELSGFTQGDRSHLVGETITLDSNGWEGVSVFDTEVDFQDSDNSQTLDGAQTFDGTAYASGLRVEAEYQLTVVDPDGNTYTLIGFNINEPGGSPAYGTVEGLAFIGGPGGFPPPGVPLTVVAASEGGSRPYADLATPICFVKGTRIATPGGHTPIEALQPGDRIRLFDGGAAPIRRVLSRTYPNVVLQADPRYWPVRIARNAFGRGVPARDVLVSQQHRVLVEGWQAQMFFGEDRVLIPAGKLIDDARVRLILPPDSVTYYHLVMDFHHVVLSDGLGCETYRGNPQDNFDDQFTKCDNALGEGRAAALPCISDRRTACLRANTA